MFWLVYLTFLLFPAQQQPVAPISNPFASSFRSGVYSVDTSATFSANGQLVWPYGSSTYSYVVPFSQPMPSNEFSLHLSISAY